MEKKHKQAIFKQFLYNEELLFSQLYKKTKISSNLLAYFLKKLLADGTLEKKKNGKYKLTSKGEKAIPFYTEQESLNPLTVILLAVRKENKILLIQREKRPYKGLWSIISGRLLLHESIAEATKRIFKQKLHSDCIFSGIKAVVHERYFEKEVKHAFIFFFVDATPIRETIEHEGLTWFDINKVPKSKTISSDYYLIKNKLNSSAEVVEEIVENRGKKITIKKS